MDGRDIGDLLKHRQVQSTCYAMLPQALEL